MMDESTVKEIMESCPRRDFRCSEYPSYDKITCTECPHLDLNVRDKVETKSYAV